MISISDIVLAGGKSPRLGRAKSLERINNLLLIERIKELISSHARPVLVATSQKQFDRIATSRLNVKVVLDLFSGTGQTRGIIVNTGMFS